MSTTFVRGACPRLAAPMETGDGLLARIVPSGPMTIDAFAGLCAAAQTHGNGLMEVSARGSLQVRGLTPVSAPLFTASVEGLDIGLADGVPVLASPLPHDPTALIDAHALADEIRAAIAARDLALAPKVSVIVDGGGQLSLDALGADVRLRAITLGGATKLLVSLGGDAASATPLGVVRPQDAVALVRDMLAVIAEHGPEARAPAILARHGVARFLTAARAPLASAVPLSARPAAETIGLHRLNDGRCAIGVSLPFGQAQALDVIALLRMARANGAAWAATAPQRTLLFGPVGEMTAFALGTAADTLGFIVDARDSRRRVVACAGAPACASGLIPARTLAAEIAAHLPQGGMAVHVSGCVKGCAHPASAPLTIVGTPQGCALIHNGRARARPGASVEEEDAVAEAVRLVSTETENA
ncbi:MAG: precorrin-3B synthase [Methyloceanibacter sp.]|uniref:precorrin-3B synthase n=1 Tax=Methyloceanibacter sp. TaxID=1965321 RepID=UPI003EDE8292